MSLISLRRPPTRGSHGKFVLPGVGKIPPGTHPRHTERAGATKAFLLGLLLLASSVAYAQMPTEKPSGYVSDFAGVLSPAVRAQLENLSTELDQKAHAQLAVVIVKSLEGRPLEDFTVELASRWGIGHKAQGRGDEKADRGILLFLAIADRRSRIEVGYGLEPIITDGQAGSILRSMTPYLRNSDYDSAVTLGASTLAEIIAQDANVSLAVAPPRPARILRPADVRRAPISLIRIILILVFLFPFLLFQRRRRPYGGFWYGGPGFGGFSGGGGGGFGGGGFGGFGGGSFGGGGASGSW